MKALSAYWQAASIAVRLKVATRASGKPGAKVDNVFAVSARDFEDRRRTRQYRSQQIEDRSAVAGGHGIVWAVVSPTSLEPRFIQALRE